MDKACLNIVIFDHSTSKTRCLRIHKETFKIATYLLAFAFLSITLFFFDYIQVKKKTPEIYRLRQELNTQMSQIQLFSAGIEHLEARLLKLKHLDGRIQRKANLQGIEERNEDGLEVFKKRLILFEEKSPPEDIVATRVDHVAFSVIKRRQ
ncbi:MAG: hypothetical protein WCO26_14910 [Deltaproteobacteria bacterium]